MSASRTHTKIKIESQTDLPLAFPFSGSCTTLPSLLATTPQEEREKEKVDRADQERARRGRFKMFWMAALADGIKDDLERIRKVRWFSLLFSCP
jgi:hypothetical protein